MGDGGKVAARPGLSRGEHLGPIWRYFRLISGAWPRPLDQMSSRLSPSGRLSQCDPKAAAKMVGCSSIVWARSLVPKSELNPTTTSNKSRSTYRMSTPFVAPARLDLLTGGSHFPEAA